jgi:acyl carrier protein
VLRNHYAFDEFEYEDMFGGKVLKELDVDSIALLELFLVIEEGFNLKEKLSPRIDMEKIMDSPVEKFIDVVSLEILGMYNAARK